MSVYGYTNKQVDNLGEHIEYLYDSHCTDLLIENDFELEEWDYLMSQVVSGDVIVIFQLLVLNQSVTQLNQTLTCLRQKGVRLIVKKEMVDTINKASEFERVVLQLAEMAHERDRLGMSVSQTARKGQGKHGRPTIAEEKVAEIQFLVKSKQYTIREVAKACDVSVGTAYKYIRILNEKVDD